MTAPSPRLENPVTHPIVPGRLPIQQRAAIMQQALRDLQFSGWRIEMVDGPRAVVVTGAPVNHILHLLISFFTCGLWLPVWGLLAALGGVKRRHVYIDDYGNLTGL